MPLQYAVAGGCRAGNTRSHYLGPRASFVIGGTDRTTYVSKYECEVIDALNEAPNTASIVVRGFTPTVGQQVTIKVGAEKIFDGVATTVEPLRRRTVDRVHYRLDCVDWSFLLDRRLVNKEYASTAADVIATDILTNFTSGFTTTNVQTALGAVPFPNKMETVSQALTRLANLVGAFWYIDYDKDLHFRTAENYQNPTSLTTSTGPSFKRLKYHKTIDQIRTRIYVEGQGTTTLAARAVGDTTIPVDDASMFSSTGGQAITGSQFLTYTGKQAAGASSTAVGPLQSPSAPSASKVSDGGRLSGTVSYKTSFVLGSRGESEMSSASGTVAATQVSAPTGGSSLTRSAGGNLSSGTYHWKFTYVTATGETEIANDNSTTCVAGEKVTIASIPTSGDGRVTARRIYRTRVNVTGSYYLLTTLSDNSTTSFVDTTADSALGSPGSTTNTTGDTASLTSIPTGPAGTTARKVYRTTAGGSTYQYLATIGDNTTTTYTDTAADGQLGDVGPTTSHVTTSAGSTSLRVAELAFFQSGGGWVRVSGQVVRYTGQSASSGEGTLTGVPSGGTGALLADVSYGTEVLPLACVTGIPASGTGAIAVAMVSGADLNLIVQRDDTSAQTTLAGLEGGDGIHEHYIQDRRLSIAGANARGDAELTLGKDPDETVTVVSEDINVFSGRSLTVNISGIATTAKIQRVRFFWTPGRSRVQREITATNRFKGFYEYVRDLQDKSKLA